MTLRALLFLLASVSLTQADDAFFERMRDAETRALDSPAGAVAREITPNLKPESGVLKRGRNIRVLDMLKQIEGAGGQSPMVSRQAPPRVLVMLTLAMPDTALKQWFAQAALAEVPVIIRGIYGGSFKATRARLDSLAGARVQIDPTAFKRLQITSAPVVVALGAPLPQCKSRRCTDDPAPPHDRVAGNIGLDNALDMLAQEGRIGQLAAREARDTLRARQAQWGTRP